jgi:hypothetical protein
MVPMLIKAGLIESQSYSDGVLFITRLEATFANIQLENEKDIPEFVHNESRCVLYNIVMDKAFTELQSTYFIFKEDYNLRVLDQKYYVPKIIQHMDRSPNFSDISLDAVKTALEQLIIIDTLQAENLTRMPMLDERYSYYQCTVVGDLVMEKVLRHITVSCESPTLKVLTLKVIIYYTIRFRSTFLEMRHMKIQVLWSSF